MSVKSNGKCSERAAESTNPHLYYSKSSMIFHLFIIRVMQCPSHFTVTHEQSLRKAPSQRIRLQELEKMKCMLRVQVCKAKCAKESLTTGHVLICVENPSLTDLLAEFEARKQK